MNRAGYLAAALFSAALAADAQRLSLRMKQAVEIALEEDGNTRVRLVAEAIRQAESRKGQARAALLPNIDGTLLWENRVVNLEAFGVKFALPGTPLRTPAKVGPFDVYDARGRGTQTIFNYSAIRRYQASKSGLRAALAEGESTREEVALQVAKAYLAALRAAARLEAAQANVALAEELLRLAENQKAAGTGTGIDVTRASVQLANEKQQLLGAVNDRRRAHLELLRAMDLRLDTEIELADRLAYHPLDPPAPDEALRQALENRGDWRAQQRREETARFNHSAAKWERLPTASVFGDYGAIGSAPNDAFPTRSYGVRITIPVFDGGRVDERRAESASLLRQEMIRKADLRARIELEIRLALDALQSAQEQVEVAEAGLALARQELEQARRRFRAGVATGIEVTDAQNRIARARDNHIAALFQYESARLDFGHAVGKIEEMVR